ncbi:MAG: alpha/beta fold hydrolase [Clostridia bacterium]|nr:alpha/beta fold hydrolase [Clostridia bacterium]
MKKSRLVIVSLIIILIGCLIASGVQTDFGNVKIKDVRIAGADGNIIHGYLYIPKGVTSKNPAPGIVTIHGYINSLETQSGFNIEYARRGYVVLSIDMPGHGYSDTRPGEFAGFFSGGVDAVGYMATLPIVDKTKIAIEGHSMGGWNAVLAQAYLGKLLNTVVLVGSSPSTFGLPAVEASSPYNFALVYGKYDEFYSVMYETKKPIEVLSSPKMKTAFGTSESIAANKLYGSFENKTARKIYITDDTHPGEHISKESIGAAVEFVQSAMPGLKVIDPNDQVWPWKEFGTLVALLGIGLFIISLGALLLDTPYFGRLKLPVPENLKFRGSKALWGIMAVIATAIPALTFFKFYHLADKITAKALMPQKITNAIVIWALLNALIFLVIFLIWHFAFAKKAGGNYYSYGLSTDSEGRTFKWGYLGKTFLLSALVIASAYLLSVMALVFFKVDFRIWVVALKAMNTSQLGMFFIYLIPFFIFFLINGLAAHSYLRFKTNEGNGRSAAISYVASAAIGCLGMAVLVILQVVHLLTAETLMFPTEALQGIIAYQFVPLLAFTGFVTVYFNKKTSNIFTGAFVNAMFITWYVVAGQATHFFR